MDYQNKYLENIIIKKLHDLGFVFNDKVELYNFVKSRITLIKRLNDPFHYYYVDGKELVVFDTSIKIQQKDDFTFTASTYNVIK